MLTKIRELTQGWIIWVFLVVIAIAFTFWGIDFSTVGSTAIVQVNGEDIDNTRVRQQYQQRLAQYQQFFPDGVPEQTQIEVRDNVIDEMVRYSLIQDRVREKDYGVSPLTIVEEIKKLPGLEIDGNFSQEAYENLLVRIGRSKLGFEAEMALDQQVQQLQNALTRTSFATSKDIERKTRLENEKRELDYIEFEAAKYSDQIELSEAELRDYFESNRDDYQSEEMVDFDYVELEMSQVMRDAEVTEDELSAYYDEQISAGRFDKPEERKARHILVRVDAGADEAADAEAKTKAEALLARVQGGEDFAAIATAESDDPGSAKEGGDLGWAERTAYVGAFADALFSMEENEIRGPIKTSFGYHIIRMEGLNAGKKEPFAKVKNSLREELQRERSQERYYDLANTLDELAYENADSLSPLVDELGLEIKTFSKMTRAGGAGALASNPEVIEAAFSERVLQDSENSKAIQLEDDRVIVLRVVEHYEPEPLEFEVVKDEVERTLTADRAEALAKVDGEAVRAELNADIALDSFSETYPEASIKSKTLLGRRDTNVPAELRETVFAGARPAEGDIVVGAQKLNSGNYVVYRVSGWVAGAGENDVARKQLGSQMGRRELAAFSESLEDDAKIKLDLEQLQ